MAKCRRDATKKMREKKIICSECGAVLTEETVHNFEGHIMCEECFNRCTVTCDNCNQRIWRDRAEGDSNYILCHHCYEYSYRKNKIRVKQSFEF